MCCCVVFYNCHSLNFFNSAAFHCECNFFFFFLKRKEKSRDIVKLVCLTFAVVYLNWKKVTTV